jgi:ubiquinone/menaquinone biosynthesis C-methylase UbiE
VANEGQQRQWNDAGMIERWKRVEPSTEPVLAPLITAVAVRPGERLLDVGCGGGLTTLAAAKAAGPAGRATGADLSERLAALARARADAAGLANVQFVVADAQEADFPGAPFDIAMSRFGVMFFADPFAAFANIGRHVKEGGRIAFACWQEAEQNRWSPREVLARYAPAVPPRADGLPQPGPFALGDVGLVERLLSTAGFCEIEHANHEYQWSDPLGGPLFDPAQLNGLRLDEATLRRATADLQSAERAMARNGVVTQQRQYRIFTARK